MSIEFNCPLMAMKSGDYVANAYVGGGTVFARTVYRANCPKCSTGFIDFTATSATPTADDPSRYEAYIDKVRGIKRCGGSKN